MNGCDENGRAGPAAEIATEAGGRSHSTERNGPTRLAATPTPIVQSRFFDAVGSAAGAAAPIKVFSFIFTDPSQRPARHRLRLISSCSLIAP
jgi:hypothetical protein